MTTYQWAALSTAAMLTSTATTGCGLIDRHTRLELAANALSRAADECLYDVRDRKLKYDESPNCNALGALAGQFIEAGGFHAETPEKYALVAAEARATAWMARAIAASGDRRLRIW